MEQEEVTRRAEFAVRIALGSTAVPDAVKEKLIREMSTEILRAYADGLTKGSISDR